MENKKICTHLLEILLDVKIDHVENLTPEFTLESLADKCGVRLDVYLKDSDRVFDVEMQTRIYGDEGLRARYYQSEIDMKMLDRREPYRNLKESYIIFLCTKDPFGKGLPVYTFENLTPEFTLESLVDKRGVRLDVYLKDSDRVFDVEMQTRIYGDEGLRARYYQSEIDMKMLDRREPYRNLKESYIIFLCTKDPFEKGLPVYTFENLCRQDNSIKLDDRTFSGLSEKSFSMLFQRDLRVLIR